MKLSRLPIAVLAFSPLGCVAAQLGPDGIICETEAPLALLRQPNMVGQGGSEIMKRMDATSKLAKLNSQVSGLLRNDAVQEETIRAAANMPGSTAAQTAAASQSENMALSDGAKADSFLQQCMATGAKPINVDIVERRPISGLVKVTILVNDRPTDLWTISAYITE